MKTCNKLDIVAVPKQRTLFVWSHIVFEEP